MQNNIAPRRGSVHSGIGYVFAILVAILLGTLPNNNAVAATIVPDEYRVGRAISKFDDTWQSAVVYKVRPPRRLRATYLELALGAISDAKKSRAFVSFGPVWQIPIYRDRILAKFGFSPTLIADPIFGDRDLGGNVHFTSSAAIQGAFGIRRSVLIALQIQHTSNAGLARQNPGMDILGISFSYKFGR